MTQNSIWQFAFKIAINTSKLSRMMPKKKLFVYASIQLRIEEEKKQAMKGGKK